MKRQYMVVHKFGAPVLNKSGKPRYFAKKQGAKKLRDTMNAPVIAKMLAKSIDGDAAGLEFVAALSKRGVQAADGYYTVTKGPDHPHKGV